MYLKSLNLLGFKSFADKTTLEFQQGVTAIVGPNGCGKSNVSDAIRWVLGEQSAKALRGGAMQDVIFNGAETRKPLGLAEVSLTIGGIDKERLSVSGIDLRYNEVTITRRVYRDGGSDYYINKTKCRLRDIQQLFMGTGMGRASYSILAQGHITQLLSSKPDDRRFVFEEAAGITAFKTQKKEALRKLQNAEQNLARIEDRVNEIRRQIGSLQRQAAKARRYKETSESLRLLETQWARHRYHKLKSDLSEKHALSSSSNDESQTLEAAIQAAEASLEQQRETLVQLESRADEERRELARTDALIQEHCHRIELSDQRLQELRERNERASVDVAQAEERLESAHSEIERLKERQQQTQSSLEERQREVSEAQQAVDAIQTELAEKQAALRSSETERDAVAAKLSTARERLSQLEMMRQNQTNALDRLESEWQEGQAELARLEAARQESATTLDKDKESIERNRETVEQRRARLRELEDELERRSNELEALSRESTELRSRYDVLEQLQNAHEGFDEGAIAALRDSEETLGALVDLIRAPDDAIHMVETALNGHLQMAIARSPEAAKAIVDTLRDENRGRACVTSTNLLNRAHDQSTPAYSSDWPRLIDQIEADDGARIVLEALIGNAYVAPSLADAMEAARQTDAAVSFVTPDGEFLDSLGLLTGGRAGSEKSQKASSALSRKNQMIEIHQRLESLKDAIEEKSRRKGETQAEITEIKSRLESIESDVQTAQVSVANREGELRGLVNSVDRLRNQLEANRSNRDRVRSEQTDGETRLHELTSARDELEETLRLAKLAVESHADALETSRTHRDDANATLSEARIRLNTERNSLESLKQSLQPLEQRVAELGHQIERNHKDMASFIERREEAKSQIEDSRNHIQELETQRETQSESVQSVAAEKQALEQAIAKAESELRETRGKLDACRQKHSGLEVELAQQTMTIEALQSRILERYELELESIEAVEFKMTLADNGSVEIEQPDEEDPSLFTPEEIDWDQVGAGVKELQRKIDSMGPVNLVAIEEYEEAEKRYEFLSQQSEELVQARESLLEAIEKINTESSRMFSETFTQIQTNFKTLFTEVFGGGKAELKLIDEADALDSGIEIIARPPGKQLQNISLLSGGEQTMTAVALLFAIYMVRPSPFCVLDELDAPLDESNIRRFVAVLQRFLDQSQFIIITHNKRTISIADVLYGVTMQQRGISKIVSYRFKEAEHSETDAPPQDAESERSQEAPPSVGAQADPTHATEAPEAPTQTEALQPMSAG